MAARYAVPATILSRVFVWIASEPQPNGARVLALSRAERLAIRQHPFPALASGSPTCARRRSTNCYWGASMRKVRTTSPACFAVALDGSRYGAPAKTIPFVAMTTRSRRRHRSICSIPLIVFMVCPAQNQKLNYGWSMTDVSRHPSRGHRCERGGFRLPRSVGLAKRKRIRHLVRSG